MSAATEYAATVADLKTLVDARPSLSFGPLMKGGMLTAVVTDDGGLAIGQVVSMMEAHVGGSTYTGDEFRATFIVPCDAAVDLGRWLLTIFAQSEPEPVAKRPKGRR